MFFSRQATVFLESAPNAMILRDERNGISDENTSLLGIMQEIYTPMAIK